MTTGLFTQYADYINNKPPTSANMNVFNQMNNSLPIYNTLHDELQRNDYYSISPVNTLFNIVGFPILTLLAAVTLYVPLLVKIIIIILLVCHIVVATCFVSWLTRQKIVGSKLSEPKQAAEVSLTSKPAEETYQNFNHQNIPQAIRYSL